MSLLVRVISHSEKREFLLEEVSPDTTIDDIKTMLTRDSIGRMKQNVAGGGVPSGRSSVEDSFVTVDSTTTTSSTSSSAAPTNVPRSLMTFRRNGVEIQSFRFAELSLSTSRGSALSPPVRGYSPTSPSGYSSSSFMAAEGGAVVPVTVRELLYPAQVEALVAASRGAAFDRHLLEVTLHLYRSTRPPAMKVIDFTNASRGGRVRLPDGEISPPQETEEKMSRSLSPLTDDESEFPPASSIPAGGRSTSSSPDPSPQSLREVPSLPRVGTQSISPTRSPPTLGMDALGYVDADQPRTVVDLTALRNAPMQRPSEGRPPTSPPTSPPPAPAHPFDPPVSPSAWDFTTEPQNSPVVPSATPTGTSASSNSRGIEASVSADIFRARVSEAVLSSLKGDPNVRLLRGDSDPRGGGEQHQGRQAVDVLSFNEVDSLSSERRHEEVPFRQPQLLHDDVISTPRAPARAVVHLDDSADSLLGTSPLEPQLLGGNGGGHMRQHCYGYDESIPIQHGYHTFRTRDSNNNNNHHPLSLEEDNGYRHQRRKHFDPPLVDKYEGLPSHRDVLQRNQRTPPRLRTTTPSSTAGGGGGAILASPLMSSPFPMTPPENEATERLPDAVVTALRKAASPSPVSSRYCPIVSSQRTAPTTTTGTPVSFTDVSYSPSLLRSGHGSSREEKEGGRRAPAVMSPADPSSSAPAGYGYVDEPSLMLSTSSILSRSPHPSTLSGGMGIGTSPSPPPPPSPALQCATISPHPDEISDPAPRRGGQHRVTPILSPTRQ